MHHLPCIHPLPCHLPASHTRRAPSAARSLRSGYLTTSYPRMLDRIDKFTYGGEDVTVAYALKKAGGVSVVNAGCLYQHEPQKYARLHAKAIDWVKWPLSTTPASFHKFKDDVEMRAFFGCALYGRDGRPRPSPRSLLFDASANGSASEVYGEGRGGAGHGTDAWPTPCGDSWVPPRATRPRARAVVEDGGIVRIRTDADV